MDTDRIAALVRDLRTTPSRRAVSRGLIAVTAGSIMAPLARLTGVGAKKHKGGRRKKKRHKTTPACARGSVLCDAVDFHECCSTATNPNGDPYEVCTDCGCCGLGFSQCCQGQGEGLCCKNDDTCCYGPNFEVTCCSVEQKCCGGTCVPKDYQSCGGTYCCHPLLTCCSDNRSCCFNPLNCPCSA